MVVNGSHQETLNFLRFSRWQVVTIVCVFMVIGWLTYSNLQIAAQRARDWERKEMLKSIGNRLIQSYRIENRGLPQHNAQWQITGCEATACPVEGESMGCNWDSVSVPGKWFCGEHIYMNPLPKAPENKQTPGADAPKYKKLSNSELVLEICLEDADDAEREPLSKSQIGWNEGECPSGFIYQWPDEDQR